MIPTTKIERAAGQAEWLRYSDEPHLVRLRRTGVLGRGSGDGTARALHDQGR